MRLQIFNVEHGACALLTCDDGKRIMIDCGHNATTWWRPGTYLRSIGVTYLDKLIITNYDEDHVSGIDDLFDKVSVGWIARNPSVSPADIKLLKSEDGMGLGIKRLVREVERNFLPPGAASGPSPTFQGVAETYFYHYPRDFADENNLSLVVKLTCNGINIMFPGDLETAGWLKMLSVPGFLPALQNMDVFVASHHGRENGYCEDIFRYFKPTFVVISDKSKGYQTQETTARYADRAHGGYFNGEPGRKVVTTRSDGDLVIEFGTNQYWFKKDSQPAFVPSAADLLVGLTTQPPPVTPPLPRGLASLLLTEPANSPPPVNPFASLLAQPPLRPSALASLLPAEPSKPDAPLSALAELLRKK